MNEYVFIGYPTYTENLTPVRWTLDDYDDEQIDADVAGITAELDFINGLILKRLQHGLKGRSTSI